jgi:arylsulfatase A-like enzyme
MLHPSFETLQDLLGAAGYQTLAIHSNGYVDPPTGVLDGMDQVIHYPPQAHAGTNAALRHLGSLSETRFFLFLHYIDPHQWPTLLPESLRDRVDPGSFSSRERGEVLRIYDDLVRTVDIELERFLSALDARSLASDTVIVFLSDHGERFFEKGVVGSHGGSHYESVLRVPLAIWLPGHPGEDVPTRVSLVDVTPTLLEMAGIEAPGSLVGTSLMPLIRATATADREVDAGLVLWSAEEAALVTGHWKYVYRPGQGDLLFDLEADPGENHNLVGRHPALASELRTRLVARSRADRKRSEDLEYPAVFLQKPTLDSLRALGYVD